MFHLINVVLASVAIQGQPTSDTIPPVLEAVCTSRDGRRFNIAGARLSISNIRMMGSRYYRIEGDKILISDSPTERFPLTIYDAFFVTRSTERNVVIFHADLDGVPYIYWLEKRDRELSRNGLLSIAGDRIALACEGTIYR